MHRIAIRATWVLRDHPEGDRLMHQLMPLLAGIHEDGSLALACEKAGISYRHGWGLVRQASQAFGAPLVKSVRGRGAKLTTLGMTLHWAGKRIAARLSPTLDSMSTELEAELERASPESRGALRINASHAYALTALRDALASRHVPAEITYRGSFESLATFHRGDCDIAGFHVPVGDLEQRILSHYRRWLKPDANVLVNLVERRLGIIVAKDNPRNIVRVADLAHPGVRFVNRQPGSGTRLIFERLLEREGVQEKKVRGYDQVEYTHAAVSALIASGMADAGIGIETAARQFHLGFVPLMTERYFLILRREALDSPMVSKLLAVLRNKDFKAQLVRLQGLDCASCGSVVEIAEAFPSLAPAPARSRRKR